jgi:hypothetical protein
MSNPSHRVRFKFRVGMKLNLPHVEYRLVLGGREVVLQAEAPGADISSDECLVMNARGLRSEGDARSFAARLKAAAELSSVASKLGIDAGVDLPTSGVAERVSAHIQSSHGVLLRDDVHGIDVF